MRAGSWRELGIHMAHVEGRVHARSGATSSHVGLMPRRSTLVNRCEVPQWVGQEHELVKVQPNYVRPRLSIVGFAFRFPQNVWNILLCFRYPRPTYYNQSNSLPLTILNLGLRVCLCTTIEEETCDKTFLTMEVGLRIPSWRRTSEALKAQEIMEPWIPPCTKQ